MGLFDKMKEPVFLKESSNARGQLEKLEALEPMLNDECKNMVGNIEINNVGDFIRTTEFSGKKKKEGIYSPITQNQRHLELMKKINIDSKTNILKRFMAEKFFENFFIPIVVLANPNTILNARFAKKEVKNQVKKADQIVNFIKETCKKSKEVAQSDKELLSWAQSFLDFHIETDKLYTSKFDSYLINQDSDKVDEQIIEDVVDDVVPDKKSAVVNIAAVDTVTVDMIAVEETEVFKELKAYRLNKSREEKIKPYFIYNDNQLKDLVSKMPTTEDMLMMVSGFGAGKVAKYGKDIIPIVKKYI